MINTKEIREMLKNSKDSLDKLNELEKLARYGEAIEEYFKHYTFMKCQIEEENNGEYSYEDVDIVGLDELLSFMGMDHHDLKLFDLNLGIGKKYKDNVHDLVWVVAYDDNGIYKILALSNNTHIRIENHYTIEELISAKFTEVC